MYVYFWKQTENIDIVYVSVFGFEGCDDLRICKSCVNMKRECSVKLGSFG